MKGVESNPWNGSKDVGGGDYITGVPSTFEKLGDAMYYFPENGGSEKERQMHHPGSAPQSDAITDALEWLQNLFTGK